MSRVLLAADDLIESAKGIGDPLSGTLRIGIIPTISLYLLPAIAAALRATHPNLTVLWVEDKTQVLAHELAQGRIDAALLALEAELGDVDSRRDRERSLVLATSTAHPLGRSARPAHAQDLRGEQVLCSTTGTASASRRCRYVATPAREELGFVRPASAHSPRWSRAAPASPCCRGSQFPREARRGALALRRFAKPAPSARSRSCGGRRRRSRARCELAGYDGERLRGALCRS